MSAQKNNRGAEAKKTVYSYHTFMLPFVWNNKIVEDETGFDKYIGLIEAHDGGKWLNISFNKSDEKYITPENDIDAIKKYQQIQYFTVSARESMFGYGNKNYVKCFSYDPEAVHDNACYYVKKNSEVYKLELNGIKLNVYNTGIAVLIFECQNYDYRTVRDVKNINEWGRRIYPPYISEEGCGNCADVLGVEIGGNKFYDVIDRKAPVPQRECIPRFIRKLLPEKDIYSAIDDRMYVACLLMDEKIALEFSEYQHNENTSQSLYEFVYIDREGFCSCPTKKMREELLEASLYTRWTEFENNGVNIPTMFGVSHHSFVCFTGNTKEKGKEDDPYVERPFLTLYVHMAAAVVAQRAAILAFDLLVSDLSENFEKPKRSLKRDKIKKLSVLQEKYIAFLNQHMNIEVTCQEQGIELYNMLQKHSYVNEENEKLANEIGLLYDAANTATSIKLDRLALRFAVILAFAEPVAEDLWRLVSPAVYSLFDFIVRLFS